MHPDAVERLRNRYRVVADFELGTDPGRLLPAVAEARALIVRNLTRVDRPLLDAAPRLEVVGRLGVGMDNIDVEACNSRGIAVRTAAGANAVSVAEHVIGALLALSRPHLLATDRVAAGEWPRTDLIGREVAGRRLAILGLGATGREVARRASALGMVVVASDPFVTDAPFPLLAFPEVLDGADAVSIHVPLTAETRHLIDRAAIERLAPDALLVDCSRGGVVDHQAVIDALQDSRLAGAALDVFPVEPLDGEAAARYRNVPGLVLSPHLAGITVESNRRVGTVVAEAVTEVLG